MAERWGRVSWPGIVSPTSCTYTQSHGIQPGVAVIVCNPQPGIPYASEGTLTIYDGTTAIRLPGCKVVQAKEERNASGVVWKISIVDRRWKWGECGSISLYANQLDPNGKFIPWTVASPIEIAQRCLFHMGETRYKIDLPVGLTTEAAAGIKQFLPTGVNFPPSGVNPPIDWQTQRPMVVLSQLADMFGRVVVYRWKDDSVWITQRGSGGPLPPGSVKSTCPGVDVPKVPDGVGVVGSPTRYQGDFELLAVGEEWNGMFLPINELSYAPVGQAKTHKVQVKAYYRDMFRYYLKFTASNKAEYNFSAPSGLGGAIDVLTDLRNSMLANADVAALVSISAPTVGGFSTFVIESLKPGLKFEVAVSTQYVSSTIPDPPPRTPRFQAEVTQEGDEGKASWARAHPPYFHGVRATDRLTLGQAVKLAQKTVWKYFQLSGRDVSGKGPIVVPGVGRVEKYRIVLQDEQCEQIVPEPVDFGVRDAGGNLFVKNFYNGVSKNKPAAAYGSVNRDASGLTYLGVKDYRNTDENEEIFVSFTVDPTFHLVRFSNHVYRWGVGGNLEEPKIRLRTACYVRDRETNAFLSYTSVFRFNGKLGNSINYERRDDVQLNVIPTYNPKTKTVVNVKILEADPVLRARYYLSGMAARYVLKKSLINSYNGLEPIQLDGAISQITWNVSGRAGTGAETIAGLNAEPNTSYPSYPQRRRQELLDSAVKPGQFLGQIGQRSDPTLVPFERKG